MLTQCFPLFWIYRDASLGRYPNAFFVLVKFSHVHFDLIPKNVDRYKLSVTQWQPGFVISGLHLSLDWCYCRWSNFCSDRSPRNRSIQCHLAGARAYVNRVAIGSDLLFPTIVQCSISFNRSSGSFVIGNCCHFYVCSLSCLDEK